MPKKSTTAAAAPAAAPVVATMLPPEGQKSAAAARKEIARLSAKVATERLTPAEHAKLADAKRAEAAPAKKPPRKLAKASTKAPAKKAAKSAPAAAPADGRIPLKAICQKLDIDPKRARVVLRRRLRANELRADTHEIGGGRWMLTPSKAALVQTTLREFLREQA